MPLFDFRCRTCGHEFESLVRNNIPPAACPSCHAPDLERLLSTFAATSREKRQAAASKQVKSAATRGRQETIAADREAEAHRKEDF